MPSQTIQLLLDFLFVSVGFIGGALVALLWGERERRNARTRQEPTPEETPAELAQVATLWRNTQTGQLLTEVKGNYFDTQDKLNPNQHLEMAKAVREWRMWLGLSAETPAQPQPNPLPNETVRVEAPRTATPARPPVNGVDTIIALPPAANAAATLSDASQPGNQPTLTPAYQPRQLTQVPKPSKKNAKSQ
jgi:hypothetical protein